MEGEIFPGAVQQESENKRKMWERFASLEGMIRKGGRQGEDAKKKLFKEFGPQAMAMIMEIERGKKK